MSQPSNRREFLQTTAGLLAGGAALSLASSSTTRAGEFNGKIRKAVKYHMITEKIPALDKFKLLVDIGFDGVEPRAMLKPEQAEEVKQIAKASEVTGLPIHGVVNSSNPDIKRAIDLAKRFGANSVLHVVRYDKKIPYLQNYRETQDIIRRAIDHAEKNEVSILIENVWATYLIEPLGMARFIDELDSPFVQVYFDVGNVVRWGWPQHWIEVLGSRIGKLDVKEFDINVAMNEGMRKGFGMPLGEGSVEWDKVRAELLKLDYKGWATAEVPGGDRARLAEIAAQMDRVLDL